MQPSLIAPLQVRIEPVMPITHLLLDIEGTTCPVQFVAEVLFPYARRNLKLFLERHGDEPEVTALVEAVHEAWQNDRDPGAQALLAASGSELGDQAPALTRAAAVVPYLAWLIDHDIKATALKDLQGRIWEAGYADGEIVAPLFEDVPNALRRWHAEGLVLAVYSSGSVAAQQLLYGHSQAGDLRDLFSHWFDTRTGPKQEAASYRAIASAMGCSPAEVLFISDSPAELRAADAVGMVVLFSDRAGNPCRDSGSFERISDYGNLSINDDDDRS
jgi:enolase-phosphatase E1